MRLKSILVLSILLAPAFLSGQEKWTLDNCINHALTNSLTIKESLLDVSLSKSNLNQTKFNYLPTLKGDATHGYNWGQRIDPFTNTFATEQVRSNNFYLSSSMTLFSGLQNYHLKEQAKSDYKAQQYNVEIQERNLKIDVSAAFLQAILNREILATYQEQLKLTKQQQNRMRILVDSDRKTQSDLLEIEAQIALDELNITKTTNDIKTSILLLKQLINLPKKIDFEIEPIEITPINQLLKDVDYSSLPETQQTQEQLTSSLKSLQLSKGRIFPSLSLNAQAGSGFSGNNKELNPNGKLIPKPFNTQLDENLYQSVTLTLSIPILDRHQTTFNIQKAKIEVERATINQEKSNQDIENKIEQLKVDIENAQSEFFSSEKALKFAQLSYQNAELKYENGVIDFTSLNEINTKLFLAQSNLIQAKYQHYFKHYVYSFYKD